MALPPAVTGAVVMLIGFDLATVAGTVYWPQDQRAGLVTMVVVMAATVLLPGFWGRIGVLIGLVTGFAFSVLLDAAAYWVAAVVAVLLGFCPKFGAVVVAVPGGVLGGLTVVLYGMVGLLGARIWVQNRVDLGHPANLIPLAAGLIIGIGGVTLALGQFQLSGIALGTIVVLAGCHGLRAALPASRRPPVDRADDAETATVDASGTA